MLLYKNDRFLLFRRHPTALSTARHLTPAATKRFKWFWAALKPTFFKGSRKKLRLLKKRLESRIQIQFVLPPDDKVTRHAMRVGARRVESSKLLVH